MVRIKRRDIVSGAVIQHLRTALLVLEYRRANPVAECVALDVDLVVLIEQSHASRLAFGTLNAVHVAVVELCRHDLERCRLSHNEVTHQLCVDSSRVVCVLLGRLELLEHRALNLASRLYKLFVGDFDLGVLLHLSLHDLSLVVDELACFATRHHLAFNAQVINQCSAELSWCNVGLVFSDRDCNVATGCNCSFQLVAHRRRHFGHALGQPRLLERLAADVDRGDISLL